MSRVMILDYDKNMAKIIDHIFEQFAVNMSGKKVFVKPNLLGPYTPEEGATTSPELIEAIVRKCLSQGAEVIVGDNPGGVTTNSYESGKVAGLVDASLGCFRNISDRVVSVPTKSKYTEQFLVSKVVMEAEYVINVPMFKTHMFVTLTGAVKNLFGYVAGSGKSRLHLKAASRTQFSELLCDLYQIRIPDLNIVDAIRCMEGNGPTHGKLRDLGKILASDDAFAVDATMSRMMGVEPDKIKYLKTGAEMGLGKIGQEDIEVLGKLEQIPDFLLPGIYSSSASERLTVFTEIAAATPRVDEEACIQCGDCEQNCPAHTITLDPYPIIGLDKCISCFCCVELCHENAIKLPDLREKFDRMI